MKIEELKRVFAGVDVESPDEGAYATFEDVFIDSRVIPNLLAVAARAEEFLKHPINAFAHDLKDALQKLENE